jgi:hypothetical protein
MVAVDPALPFEPLLGSLAAIGRIGPDVGYSAVARHDIPEHPSVEAGSIGDLALTDESEGPADRELYQVSMITTHGPICAGRWT